MAQLDMSSSLGRSEFNLPSSFKGKYIGLLVLAIFQAFVGAVHIVFGLFLPMVSSLLITYGGYTLFYGIITTASAYGLWRGKRWGWMGTIVISVIVIAIDTFIALNLPILLGVPKFAAIGEIPYSIAVMICLVQPRIKREFIQENGN